jgi:hypothetical protein
MTTLVISIIVAIAAFALGSRYTEKENAMHSEIQNLYNEISRSREDAKRDTDISERYLNERMDEITNELAERVSTVSNSSKKVK